MASLRIFNFEMLHLVDSIASLHNELYFMRFIYVLFPYFAYIKCFNG